MFLLTTLLSAFFELFSLLLGFSLQFLLLFLSFERKILRLKVHSLTDSQGLLNKLRGYLQSNKFPTQYSVPLLSITTGTPIKNQSKPLVLRLKQFVLSDKSRLVRYTIGRDFSLLAWLSTVIAVLYAFSYALSLVPCSFALMVTLGNASPTQAPVPTQEAVNDTAAVVSTVSTVQGAPSYESSEWTSSVSAVMSFYLNGCLSDLAGKSGVVNGYSQSYTFYKTDNEFNTATGAGRSVYNSGDAYHIRYDCSGFVSTCLQYYVHHYVSASNTVVSDYLDTLDIFCSSAFASGSSSAEVSKLLKSLGFTYVALTPSYCESLKAGDIIAYDGHVAIFTGWTSSSGVGEWAWGWGGYVSLDNLTSPYCYMTYTSKGALALGEGAAHAYTGVWVAP